MSEGQSSPDRSGSSRPDTRLSRRGLLAGGAGAAGIVAGAGGTQAGHALAATSGPDPKQLSPSEDLMREHGVLKRVLLIYREIGRRLRDGEDVPGDSLREAAEIIHEFVESFHEGLEERYVFPRLQQAGKLGDTVDVLLVQHARGRRITQDVLAKATSQALADQATRKHLASALEQFVAMYEPHEAREDTVVFPTFRRVIPAKTITDLGQRFEEEEHRQFGEHGFADAVHHVGTIEKALGIHDLNQFTPHV